MIANDVVIKTIDLRVDYGDVRAVAGLNLEIKRGEIYGLIGPNGSGKTSTFKVLTTLLEPTYGDVYIEGKDIAEQGQDVHKILGYMPDIPIVYKDLKVWEFFDLFAGAYFVPAKERKQRVNECLALVNLEGKRNALTSELSRGMKQRLLLGKTLIHKPSVLILDEPAGGLDPLARIELRNILKDLAAEGKTILISSHILTELEGFCTSIGILEKGHLVTDGKIDEIRDSMTSSEQLFVEVIRDKEIAMQIIEGSEVVHDIKIKEDSIIFQFDGSKEERAAILAQLIENNIAVTAFYEKKMNVEDIFMQVGANEVN